MKPREWRALRGRPLRGRVVHRTAGRTDERRTVYVFCHNCEGYREDLPAEEASHRCPYCGQIMGDSDGGLHPDGEE